MVDDELLKALKNRNLKDICLIKHGCKRLATNKLLVKTINIQISINTKWCHINKMKPMIKNCPWQG
jgi:hypothetical protein